MFAAANVKRSKQGQLAMSDIDCEITSDNDDIINAINAFEQSKGCITTPPTATTAGHLLFMATRAQGKPLLQLLKTDATLRGLLMGLNQTFDADQMIGSTDGLFSIAIDAFGKDWTPSFCMKAETRTSHLLTMRTIGCKVHTNKECTIEAVVRSCFLSEQRQTAT